MTTEDQSAAELPARDKCILEFEKLRWKHLGLKDTAVLVLFGLSPIAYSQTLQSIIDRPEAETYDPEYVRRLRRIRDARLAARPSRRLGFIIA
jgi:hypothetical protein